MDSLEERAKRVLAQGSTGTNSKRASAYIQGVYPTHVISARGCKLYCSDQKEYIDFVSGLGTNILGYDNPVVQTAVRAQLAKGGPNYTLPHYLEIEVAELIQEMVPCAERIRFLKTGNEATLAAVRIARAYKEIKDDDHSGKWVKSEGYHGHGDLWVSKTPPATGVDDVFNITIFGEEKTLPVHHDVYICEPIETDSSNERKKQLVERCCGNHLNIFDEVVTGFRVPKYTVASWWDIQPDLICLGKAIANGYPLSVVAGKKELMDEDYFISSTFSGEAMSLAAAKATLEELKKKSMDDLYFYANRFCDQFNEICKPIGSNIKGYGTRGQTDFYENENTILLFQELCKSGVLFGRAFFYNFAHMESEVETQVLSLVQDAVNKIKQGKVKLEGVAPKATFKR